MNQVSFESEQVTTEMQGVKVTGNLFWRINDNEEGPFKAYTNLGADIASENPHTANSNLQQQAAAIVRDEIANSKLEVIIKDRKSIVEAITKNLQSVCKGWGVVLESVEIAEVLISSGQLFKDLQAEFREKCHQEAEMISMKINTELSEFRNKEDEELNKFRAENQAEIRNIQNICQIAIKDMQEKGKLEQQKILEEKQRDQAEYNKFNLDQDNIYNKRYSELDSEYRVA